MFDVCQSYNDNDDVVELSDVSKCMLSRHFYQTSVLFGVVRLCFCRVTNICWQIVLASETPLRTNNNNKNWSLHIQACGAGIRCWFYLSWLWQWFHLSMRTVSSSRRWLRGVLEIIRSFTASDCTVKVSTVYLSLLPTPPPPTHPSPPAHCLQWRMKLEEGEEENVLLISVAWWHLCDNERGERAGREGCREIERDRETETDRHRHKHRDRQTDRQTET